MHEQHLKQAVREALAERAAILEHEAGIPHREASGLAMRAMRVYRIDGTDRVLVLPGVEIEEARQFAEARIGAPVQLTPVGRSQWL